MFDLSLGQRLFIFTVGMVLGFFFLFKHLWVVHTIGQSEWAESHFPGGTYGAIKIFGITIMIVAIVILFQG